MKLIEDLLYWQQFNAITTGVGFIVCGIMFLWLLSKIDRLEQKK